MGVEHSQYSTVLIDYGCGRPSVLDVGVPADLFLGAEYAVDCLDAPCIYLVFGEVGLVEGKALKFFSDAVVKKRLVQLHVTIKNGEFEHGPEVLILEISVHNSFIARI